MAVLKPAGSEGPCWGWGTHQARAQGGQDLCAGHPPGGMGFSFGAGPGRGGVARGSRAGAVLSLWPDWLGLWRVSKPSWRGPGPWALGCREGKAMVPLGPQSAGHVVGPRWTKPAGLAQAIAQHSSGQLHPASRATGGPCGLACLSPPHPHPCQSPGRVSAVQEMVRAQRRQRQEGVQRPGEA